MKHSKIQLLLLLVTFFIIVSCGNETKIDGNLLAKLTISSEDSVKIKLTKISNVGMLDMQEEVSVITKDKNFQTTQKTNKLQLCFLLADDKTSLFYIGPDMDRNMKIEKDEKNGLKFVFDDDPINNFTNKFHQALWPLFSSGANEEEFINLIDETQTQWLKYLNKLQSKIDATSFKILDGMVKGKMAHIKFLHAGRFDYLTPQSSYFDFTNNFIFDNDNFLTYSDNLNTVFGVLENQYEKKYNTSFQEQDIKNQIEYINELIDNDEIKSATISFLSIQAIPEKTEAEKTEILNRLKDLNIKDHYYEFIATIDANTAIAVEKKVGTRAKFLETLMPQNKDFSIENLRGKIVYIDNWATWCGPCAKSMKKFVEKQKNLIDIDNIVYVFVSFDRNESIWRKYLKNVVFPKNNVVHLFNGSDMNTPYAKYYNIYSLPSYFVINQKGIISDVAPINPSDDGYEEFIRRIAGM